MNATQPEQPDLAQGLVADPAVVLSDVPESQKFGARVKGALKSGPIRFILGLAVILTVVAVIAFSKIDDSRHTGTANVPRPPEMTGAPGGRAWVYPFGAGNALAGIYGIRIHPDTALDELRLPLTPLKIDVSRQASSRCSSCSPRPSTLPRTAGPPTARRRTTASATSAPRPCGPAPPAAPARRCARCSSSTP